LLDLLFRRGGRRPRLVALGLVFLGLAVVLAVTRPAPVAVPPAERLLRQVVQASGAVGGVIAWGRPGEAPQVRALGLADRATGRTMQPGDRFRLASLTKPVVAAVLHDLAARGVLSLDDPLSAHAAGAPEGITIAQAMAHLGGWDRAATGDPFFLPDAVLADRHGLTAPAQTCRDIADLPAFRTPQHPPGTTYAYSNLGYCWLGAVIEGATGAPWLDAARAAGGATLSLDPGQITVAPSLPPGAAALPVMRPGVIGPAGGLIGDAATVLTFALAQADARAEDAAAADVAGAAATGYNGRGWRVWRRDGATFYSHFGETPGTFAFVIRRADGAAAALLLNGSVPDADRAARALAADLMANPDWQ
jgi:CubicO group peptidase (beta-lactamase class C family)